MNKKIYLYIFAIILSLFLQESVNAQKLESTSSSVIIEQGKSIDVTFNLTGSDDPITSKVNTPWNNNSLTIEKITPGDKQVTVTINGIKPQTKTNLIIPFKVGNKDVDAVLEVQVKVNPSLVTFDPEKLPPLIQNNKNPGQIRMKVNGEVLRNVPVETTPTVGYIESKYIPESGIIEINATSVGFGKGAITISIDGILIPKTIDVEVIKGYQRLELIAGSQLRFNQGAVVDPAKLVQLVDFEGNKSDPDPTKLTIVPITPIEEKIIREDGKFRIATTKKGTTRFKIVYEDQNVKLSSEPLEVEINQVAKTIDILATKTILFPKQTLTLTANVLDSGGQKIEGSDLVTWSIDITDDIKNKDYLGLTENRSTNQVEVYTKENVPSSKTINVIATLKSGETKTFPIFVEEEFKVTDFAWLQVSTELVDKKTVQDDWGNQISNNYFVTKVTLANQIKNRDNEYFGSPILVYNQSLEVKVAFEYFDPINKKWVMAREEQMLPENIRKDGQIIVNPNTTGLVVPKRNVRSLEKWRV